MNLNLIVKSILVLNLPTDDSNEEEFFYYQRMFKLKMVNIYSRMGRLVLSSETGKAIS